MGQSGPNLAKRGTLVKAREGHSAKVHGVESKKAEMLGKLGKTMDGIDLRRPGLADQRHELRKVGVVGKGNGLVHPITEAAAAVHRPSGQHGGAAEAQVVDDLGAPQMRGQDDDLACRAVRVQARIQELKGLIRKAEESGEVQEALKLLHEKREMEKRLETGSC